MINQNQLIRKTTRKVVTLKTYNGVCHACNSPISYSGEMTLIELENTDDYWIVYPVDMYECPHCGEITKGMKVYKNLEVTKELKCQSV